MLDSGNLQSKRYMKLFSFEKSRKHGTFGEGLMVGGTCWLATVTACVRAGSLISEPGSRDNWVEPGWLPL